MIPWWLIAVALAQDPATDEATDDVSDTGAPVEEALPPTIEEVLEVAEDDAEVSDADAIDITATDADGNPEYIEVIVIGQQVITAARDNVVRSMKELGWKAKRKRDGRIVFRPPESWMGKAVLLPSGAMEFAQPAISFSGARDAGGQYGSSDVADKSAAGGTLGISFGGMEKKKVRAAQAAVRDEVRPLVVDYRNKLRQRNFSEMIGELPDRLDALWEQGIALDGAEDPIEGPEARRAAVLDYWSTRTDTPEGRTVSRTVEIWLRNVVQQSTHPVTPAEKAEAEARRQDERTLTL